MSSNQKSVAALLVDVQHRREGAMDELLPLVYGELRALAAAYLRAERDNHTLQPTALVHESFLKLVDQRNATWHNRTHFFAIAAQAMRRILVDYARVHRAQKRGGGAQPVTLEHAADVAADASLDVERVSEALDRLALLDERQAKVVELRFFGGLGIEETAEALGISPATVKREWVLAKAWLRRELSEDQ
jgi:RNA polymerase sigma factor (TIGR02999 family)